MLLYVTLTLFTGWVTYFWVSILALCTAPFLFNPHQFSFADFIIDYREFLRWMNRGNSRAHSNSWIGYCRLSRTMITGYKKKKLGHPSEKLSGDVPRAGWRAVIFSEVIFPVVMAVLFVVCYMFVKSFPDRDGRQPAAPLIRIAVVSLGPIVWNAAVLLVQFMFSIFLGPFLDTKYPKFGAGMAFIAHSLATVGMIAFFEFLVCTLLHRSMFTLLTSTIVVLGAVEHLARRSWVDRCHLHTARYPQSLDLGVPLPRVQA